MHPGILTLCRIITAHLALPAVVTAALKALTAMTLRQEGNVAAVMSPEMDGPHLIMPVMTKHLGNPIALRAACMLLRNLVSRDKENCKAFLDEGAEELLRSARDSDVRCEDVSFAALRDLGCDISFMKHYKDAARRMHGVLPSPFNEY